ncbi:MAG: dienelactone hydrolase family protein [Alphaproteobacteria bacterium]
MTEFQVDVATPDGVMDCFAAHPDGEGPFPPVILYMDVPGIREELRDFARRIAGQGYFCLLPDLYYRDGRVRFDLSKGEEELKKMFAIGRQLTVDRVMRDTRGMLDYFKGNDTVTDKVGCIGYCMSGQFVVAAAGEYPDDFAAIASLYGTLIVTDKPDSPHLRAANAKGELYLGFAEKDHFVEDNVIPDITAVLDANNVAYTVEVHPGTDHGFCFPQRPQYVEAAAERVWDTVFDLFERKLK